ncbi:hyaluronidase-1-like [Bombina bombina]|uniref:hyaluronidase-1-like n=1 Tax=Bombina bombina TaxID=8345 RepID=UPI00235A7252|nr:hyaluronidase-1-like [Bombina bombina]XP_053572631.1 hyaluronidase-1-like [Bombina bombina]XP_053572632.1 hyaluronidase-1-like [Bombina bombina]
MSSHPRKTSMAWCSLFLVIIVTSITDAHKLKQARKPLIKNNPFVAIWNAPTEQCKRRYNVDLDLSVFDIVINTNETLSGSNVTIFYHTHLGHYPHFTDDGHSVNGGVPQNQSLKKHLMKARDDINKFIPDKNFKGLAVIDWENWRPLWDRNWGSKDIYRSTSVKLAKEHHPDWPDTLLRKMAKEEFETAGENFMKDTARLGQEVRPDGLWGYYLFPDCYNHDYKLSPETYTGKCPNIEMKRNDMLLWLWKASGVLFPSIYLDIVLKGSPNALKFVHHRVREATRVASLAREEYDIPVYVYARPFYSYTLHALTMSDLIHTIGESAALGSAGVVLWGGMQYASTKESCTIVKNYIDDTLGRYMINVTSAAKLCSKLMCKKNGRCVRKHAHSNAYLHLNSNHFNIKKNLSGKGPSHFATGNLGDEDFIYWKNKFVCKCYEGWTGLSCELPQSEKLVQNKNTVKNSSRKSFIPASIVLYSILQISLLFMYNAA